MARYSTNAKGVFLAGEHPIPMVMMDTEKSGNAMGLVDRILTEVHLKAGVNFGGRY